VPILLLKAKKKHYETAKAHSVFQYLLTRSLGIVPLNFGFFQAFFCGFQYDRVLFVQPVNLCVKLARRVDFLLSLSGPYQKSLITPIDLKVNGCYYVVRLLTVKSIAIKASGGDTH